MKLLISLILSLLVAWLLGAIFLTSPTVCQWNEKLGLPLPVSGTSKQVRDENWNHFKYGDFGLEASDAIKAFSAEAKVLIFGDSYIEADMVKPDERVQTNLSAKGIPCVGIGISGNSCVEYNHLMGIYNKLIPNVTTNIILIADISDILPPKGVTDFNTLKPAYPFRKIEGKLGELSYRLRLMAFRNIIKKGRTTWHNGLDILGNHWCASEILNEASDDTSHYEEYWQTMLKALTAQAPDGRLIIVYAPIVPSILDNAISTANPDSELIKRFVKVCEEYDNNGRVNIVDVSPRLCKYTSETNQFPRGFFNTQPGKGHLNGVGHKILAEAIAEALAQ